MSHRVLLHRSTTANFLSYTKTRHVAFSVLRFVPPQVSCSPNSISLAQTRSASRVVPRPKAAASRRDAVRDDPMKGQIITLDDETTRKLLRLKIYPAQAKILLMIVHYRCRRLRSTRYIYDSLRNRGRFPSLTARSSSPPRPLV